MPDVTMGVVVPLCVDAVELAHASAQSAIDGLHDDVEVVVHQAVGVAHPVVALADLPEQAEPPVTVLVREVDRLSPIPPCGDVEQPARDFDA